ncbi:MAG: DUF445 domain-containing protein [Gemmatimonadaceae bacterium]|nr:DUF445 domain-containing protein [Gemmatimonadaceae bacterium]
MASPELLTAPPGATEPGDANGVSAAPRPVPAPRAAFEPPPLAPIPDEAERRRRLASMKARATGLLVVVTVLFLAARAFMSRWPWLGYVAAFGEAAMVGGIADWFAVTALFRHPLGIPIPHTAIVPSRKDRIGNALGNFVQKNFLTRDVVERKLGQMHIGERAARWLAEPANSRRVSQQVAKALAGAATVLKDEDVQALVDRGIVSRLRRTQAAPLVARLLDVITADGRHQALLDDALRLAARFIAENEDAIRERIKAESPWWVPGFAEDRLHEKIVAGVERTMAAVAADPEHPLRARYDDAVKRFVESLRSSPTTIARAEQLKLDVLDHPRVAEFSASIWADAKAAILRYAERAGDPESGEPDAIERWLASAGRAVLADAELSAKVDAWVVDAVGYTVDGAREEVAALIAQTVAAWDPNATSERIELAIGRDLQFIRINGTLVGGLVGVVIYAVAQVIAARG